MWHKLAKQISVEREQLNRLIEIHSRLIARCASKAPNDIELSALATLLHSFYTVRHGIASFWMRWLFRQRCAARCFLSPCATH